MSNGLSECTQYIFNAEADRLERIRQARNEAYRNYVKSYIESIMKKRCTCSACKTESSMSLVNIVKISQGIEETWTCSHCERVAKRTVTNADFTQWFNEDRQKA